MKPIERSEILDLGAYEQIRERFRARVIEEKKARRLALGSNITLLFENRDTVLFQIQEMLRTERITQDKAILHEIETYNELVPGERELSATFFVEYPERELRDRMLVELAGLENCFWAELCGERSRFSGPQRGDDPTRTTTVHYLKAPLSEQAVELLRGGRGPVKIGVTHPKYTAEVELDQRTLEALAADYQ